MLGFFSQTAPVAHVQIPDAQFNYKTPSHLDILNKRVERFKQAQALLKATDLNVVTGLSVGTTCWVGIYLFPLVTVSIAAFCFATYNATKRSEYYQQYTEALNDLIDVYQWSMGKDTGNHWYKLAVKEIQNLIIILGPRVYKETIHTWSADDLKPGRIEGIYASRRSDIPIDFEKKLTQFAEGKQTEEWDFVLYGENGIDDFFGTFLAAAKQKVGTEITSFSLKQQ